MHIFLFYSDLNFRCMLQKRMLAVALIQKHARRMNPQSVNNRFQPLLFQIHIFLFYSNRSFRCMVQKRMLTVALIQKHARRMNPQSVKNLFEALLFQMRIFSIFLFFLTLVFVAWYRSAVNPSCRSHPLYMSINKYPQ